MSCERARRLLIRDRRSGWLGHHLEECSCCRERAEALRRQDALLGGAWDDLPLREDFTREVMRRLRARGDQTPMP